MTTPHPLLAQRIIDLSPVPHPSTEHLPILLAPTLTVTRSRATAKVTARMRANRRGNHDTAAIMGELHIPDTGLRSFLKTSHLCVVQNVYTNCLVLLHPDLAPSVTPQRLQHAKYAGYPRYGYYVHLLQSRIPPVSHSVAIYDWVPGPDPIKFIILRYPVKLYDRSTTCSADHHRTFSRQQRESQLIAEQYPPLRPGSKPYPFFIPSVPLDPVWTPPALAAFYARHPHIQPGKGIADYRKRGAKR